VFIFLNATLFSIQDEVVEGKTWKMFRAHYLDRFGRAALLVSRGNHVCFMFSSSLLCTKSNSSIILQ